MQFPIRVVPWSLFAGLVMYGAPPGRADAPQGTTPPPGQQAPQAGPGSQPPRGEFDPKADALLHQMSSALAGLEAFQVDTRNDTQVVTKDGETLDLLAQSTVTVQRPNRLRTERNGLVGDVQFFYDGQNVAVYGKRENLYATAKAPGTLDEAIDFTRSELGIDAPSADLLYADPYKILTEDAVSGTYIGEEPVGERKCHHLAYRGNETDWQIWIEDGPRALPCRFEITSKKVPGHPVYAVVLDNWRVNPPVDPKSFTFTPPKDAGKIDFLAVKEKRESLKKQPQAPRSSP
jgi:hypothetical protein